MELFLKIFSIIFTMILLILFFVSTVQGFKEDSTNIKIGGIAITISVALVFYYLIKY